MSILVTATIYYVGFEIIISFFYHEELNSNERGGTLFYTHSIVKLGFLKFCFRKVKKKNTKQETNIENAKGRTDDNSSDKVNISKLIHSR